MSEIDKKYQQVKDANPWIGLPLPGGEHACDDGKGSFQDYSGQASIYYTPTTGAHLIYGLIRAKWIQLGREKGPNGYPTSDEADALSGKGRFSSFEQGRIAWKQDTPEAFTVYGAIYSKWKAQHFDTGPLGFPLTDESSTTGNTGRYNDFERGAIYYHPTLGTHIVRSPILEAWTIADREKGLLKFPISDTPSTKDAQNAFTQKFQGGRISCLQVSSLVSRSIVTTALVKSRIQPVTRAAILTANADAAPANTVAPDDKAVLPLIRLNRQLKLKTAVVIFERSYARTLNATEIATIKKSYARAAGRLADLTFGLGQIEYTVVDVPVSVSWLQKSDFVDVVIDGTTYRDIGDSVYSKVIAALGGKETTARFDIVSINVPWINTPTDTGGLAWSNTTHRLGNGKTWTTVHYIHPGPMWGVDPAIWWAFYVHETFHCIEWMLESVGDVKDTWNPDNPWWEAAYPRLTSSAVVPPPENLVQPDDRGDPRHYGMLQRVKERWRDLPVTWGKITTIPTTLDNFGPMLMYACPDARTLIESAWNTKYLLSMKVSKHFVNAYDFGVALGLASYQLSVELTGAGLQLAKDYLNKAHAAGEALKSVVLHLDLGALEKIQFDLIPLAVFHLQLHNRLADLRDGVYSQTIHDAFLDGLSSAYLLGINMAIAEGQVSRDPMMGLGGERNLAINGLVNAKKYVGELNQQTKIQLDASRIDKLLALFTAGQMNMVIAPQISAERASYRATIQAAPY